MINVNKSIPTKLAAAIASVLLLGGCATTSGHGQPTDPINRLASSVTEVGTRVWDGTRYLFKLKENGAEAGEDEFMDEVDMALLDTSEFNQQDTDDVDAAQPAALDEKEIIEPDSARLLPPEDAVDLVVAGNTEESEAPLMEAVSEDLFHTVAEDETLWILAKMLTGNANNWRTLAEINGLGENGSVYVGQKLRIPAELKRLPIEGEELAQQPAAAPAKEAEATPLVAAARAVDSEDRIYTVEAGESLWLLAKRTTGSPENWLAIAQYNGMDEREANQIRFGQELKIPSELLIDGASSGAVAGNTTTSQNVVKQPKEEAANAVAQAILPSKGKNVPGVEAGKSDGARQLAEADAVPAAAGENVDESRIVTVPASFKDEPPTDLPSEAKEAGQKHLLADQAPAASTLQDGEIMVSGTYYPKAIYNEANFSSSLLMRVSPGTRLKVAKTIGPWYEVVTDKGTGFVHSRDTN